MIGTHTISHSIGQVSRCSNNATAVMQSCKAGTELWTVKGARQRGGLAGNDSDSVLEVGKWRWRAKNGLRLGCLPRGGRKVEGVMI
jgi:hypothetical protein